MPKPAAEYENNPILIGINGLKLFFGSSRSIAIYSLVITFLMVVSVFIVFVGSIINGLSMSEAELRAMERSDAQSWERFLNPATPMAVIGPVAREVAINLLILVVSLLLFGVLEYAAARNAMGQKAELKEGFRTVLSEFPAYLWLYVLMSVKLLLWTLLFIIPGFIMFYRYILSGTVFFAEGKRGNAAIKRSAELTKGAWLTTFAGTSIWLMISQGLGSYVFAPGSLAVLYAQLKAPTDTGVAKPKAHILSWLTLLIPIALIILFILFVGAIVLLTLNSTTAP